MLKRKEVLTTGQAAKICRVSRNTVERWIDKGMLSGYRIPGGGHRRVLISELMRFVNIRNIPVTDFPFSKIRILVVDDKDGIGSKLGEDLKIKTDCEVQTVDSNFQAAFKIQEFKPQIILINLSAKSNNIKPESICEGIHTRKDLRAIKLIAITNDPQSPDFSKFGFDDYISISEPDNLSSVVRKIERLVEGALISP